jgi:hypothetical protein
MTNAVAPDDVLSTGAAAVELGVSRRAVIALFQRGLLPEPTRVGRNRVIRRSELPQVLSALSRGGYLRGREET